MSPERQKKVLTLDIGDVKQIGFVPVWVMDEGFPGGTVVVCSCWFLRGWLSMILPFCDGFR